MLEPTPPRMSTIDLGFDRGLHWQCQRLRPGSSSWDWETGMEAHSLEAGGPGLHPLAYSSSAQHCKASTSHSQLCSAPSSLWPPSTFTSCVLLALAARCACVYAACPFHTLSFPSIPCFFLIPPSCSLVFYVLICPLTVSQPSDFFLSSLPHPSLCCQTQRL